MFSYHPDQLYSFVNEILVERRKAEWQHLPPVENKTAWRDAVIYHSGTLLVNLGRRLQGTVGADDYRAQVAAK